VFSISTILLTSESSSPGAVKSHRVSLKSTFQGISPDRKGDLTRQVIPGRLPLTKTRGHDVLDIVNLLLCTPGYLREFLFPNKCENAKNIPTPVAIAAIKTNIAEQDFNLNLLLLLKPTTHGYL
jgi:hypothetical protein